MVLWVVVTKLQRNALVGVCIYKREVNTEYAVLTIAF